MGPLLPAPTPPARERPVLWTSCSPTCPSRTHLLIISFKPKTALSLTVTPTCAFPRAGEVGGVDGVGGQGAVVLGCRSCAPGLAGDHVGARLTAPARPERSLCRSGAPHLPPCRQGWLRSGIATRSQAWNPLCPEWGASHRQPLPTKGSCRPWWSPARIPQFPERFLLTHCRPCPSSLPAAGKEGGRGRGDASGPRDALLPGSASLKGLG